MLNSRERLKRELEAKSLINPSFASRRPSTLDKSFRVSRNEPNGGTGDVEFHSVWVDTIKGGNSEDLVAQIQVDRNVMVSTI